MGLAGHVKKAVRTMARPLTHKWTRRADVAEDAAALGVRRGGLLLVHSSLSSVGFVPGGPATIVDGLLDALGPQGTIVFPTHTWEAMEAGCRIFDARSSASCVGAITEVFRRRPGVVRSLHPTHSVAALGPMAAELVADHELAATPCGAGTPYDRLLLADGQILFLGTGLQSNTAFHTLEAIAGLQYLLEDRDDEFTIVDAGGRGRQLSVRRHKARIGRCFAETEPFYRQAGAVSAGTIGAARALLLRGAAFRSVTASALQRNPDFLLAKSAVEPAA
jgi:aminoglycoside 3-N-acetyltransferase